MKLLDSEFAVSGQNVNLTRLYNTGNGERLRLRLRSNAYKAQCHAHCDIYDHSRRQWNPLVSIDPAAMKTPEGLCYLPERAPATEHHFRSDVSELLRKAQLIL